MQQILTTEHIDLNMAKEKSNNINYVGVYRSNTGFAYTSTRK